MGGPVPSRRSAWVGSALLCGRIGTKLPSTSHRKCKSCSQPSSPRDPPSSAVLHQLLRACDAKSTSHVSIASATTRPRPRLHPRPQPAPPRAYSLPRPPILRRCVSPASGSQRQSLGHACSKYTTATPWGTSLTFCEHRLPRRKQYRTTVSLRVRVCMFRMCTGIACGLTDVDN
ncbi:hypothetical protein COCCADRAFT_112198 [Bipolaris zeicola 26-R-13]|uniref:Uncharacterized protein n=1 Tax=Cochliobolus carbonum (strain 26-R-13) TaxID=930089 RepID=W6XWZ2_COCC2|nr:uncharacterized protein COCCADRAFT_112198 [Bipolaris zeicola 26-R-13]EUC27249.1 hypothetical protein COCCADRAFT_112198 [Bipolaris zeicola 26-R-13]